MVEKKYKILVDLWNAQPFGSMKFHGGGEYIKTIYKSILQSLPANFYVVVFYDSSLFLDKWILDSFDKDCVKSVDIRNLNDVQQAIFDEKPDVFYSGMPYVYGSLDVPPETLFCGTFHGLRSLELPFDIYEYKYLGIKSSVKLFIKRLFYSFYKKHLLKLYRESLNKLDVVFCVSNHTKYAIKNFFPEANKPIECFYTPQKVVPVSIDKDVNFDKYILLISCNRFEKNAYRAIIALNKLFEKKLLQGYRVVTVGKLPLRVKKSIKYKDRFLQYDYVSPEKLEGLYAGCDFFLYPTLNEGFGMPPLEAMKYGKTCVVSAVCSVTEVCGDAVYYINPYDINEIQTRILLASENKIDIEKIAGRLNLINKKQDADLKKICDYIFKMSNRKNP
jgi:glycosyltransferase involved in cell wall biosynthesis